MSTATLSKALAPDVANSMLRDLGHRFTTAADRRLAVAVFQGANRLDEERLKIDGDCGPRTSRLLRAAHDLRGGNNLAADFGWDEFTCHCGGTQPGCRGVLVTGALVDGLVKMRAAGYRDGLHILSGYRCPGRNAATPGAHTLSTHQAGGGIDPASRRMSVAAVAKLGAFSGIGWSPSSGLVCHVDTRGIVVGTGPLAAAVACPNTSGGTVKRPTVFPDGA